MKLEALDPGLVEEIWIKFDLAWSEVSYTYGTYVHKSMHILNFIACQLSPRGVFRWWNSLHWSHMQQLIRTFVLNQNWNWHSWHTVTINLPQNQQQQQQQLWLRNLLLLKRWELAQDEKDEDDDDEVCVPLVMSELGLGICIFKLWRLTCLCNSQKNVTFSCWRVPVHSHTHIPYTHDV